MVALAGGDDPLGAAGADSRRITLEEIESAETEALMAPCGYGLDRAAELAAHVPRVNPAAVWAVDANAYFARPGPRVAKGVELLAAIFHPTVFGSPPADLAVCVR